MYVGQVSYIVFQYFGIWRPLTWNSQWRIWIYRIYSIFMITIYTIFIFSMLIYLFRDSGNISNNLETLFQCVSFSAILIKIITMMVKRKIIINLKDMLLDKLCQPRDFYELEILQNCSKVCRSTTIIFLSMFNFSASLASMSPLTKRSNFPLPVKAWIPYDSESTFAYFSTYFHQIVSITMAASVTAAVESLAMVIMLHICAQIEIIVHRLHSLPRLQERNYSQSIMYERESKLIKDFIDHHIYTYRLGEKLNESFGPVIFVQSFSSMIALGAAIYPLSKLNTSIYSISTWRLIFTSTSALAQIFLYCFYGDKIMEKSMAIAEEVYQIDWTDTTIKTKKNLTSIMIRAGKPIQLTGLSLIIMTIDTFFKIIKSAYSAYNLLKRT